MAGRRRRVTAGGLAGWLFADLALVLAFVFLDSSTQGQAGGGPKTSVGAGITTTTSVVPGETKGNGGARPEPYQIVIRTGKDASGASIISRVEAALARTAAVSERKDVVYLVVIALGGSQGRSRSTGSGLAAEVANKLEAEWGRVVKGTTYFQTGDDGGLLPGYVILKLFPAQPVSGG